MRFRLRVFLKIAALLCATASIHATTLARLSLDQLAAAADAVARVRCTGVISRWENDEIWTVSNFDVVEAMKGALPARVAVRLPGGRVGHLTATVDGTPKFIAGEEAVVFLERSRAGEFSVAGWAEGTFRILRDPRTGLKTVTQDSSTFAVFDTATRTFRAEGVRRMPLEQFRRQFAAALTRAEEKQR
jgi:hypothetical protein